MKSYAIVEDQTKLLWEIVSQDIQDRVNDPDKANHVFQQSSLDFTPYVSSKELQFQMICIEICPMSGEKLLDEVSSIYG